MGAIPPANAPARGWLRAIGSAPTIRPAATGRTTICLRERDRPGKALAARNEPHRDYIDLDQAAALVNRSKRTLERHLRKMPNPVVQGAGGKKSEWVYEELRPWLENEFGKILPKRPPHVVR